MTHEPVPVAQIFNEEFRLKLVVATLVLNPIVRIQLIDQITDQLKAFYPKLFRQDGE